MVFAPILQNFQTTLQLISILDYGWKYSELVIQVIFTYHIQVT